MAISTKFADQFHYKVMEMRRRITRDAEGEHFFLLVSFLLVPVSFFFSLFSFELHLVLIALL